MAFLKYKNITSLIFKKFRHLQQPIEFSRKEIFDIDILTLKIYVKINAVCFVSEVHKIFQTDNETFGFFFLNVQLFVSY